MADHPRQEEANAIAAALNWHVGSVHEVERLTRNNDVEHVIVKVIEIVLDPGLLPETPEVLAVLSAESQPGLKLEKHSLGKLPPRVQYH